MTSFFREFLNVAAEVRLGVAPLPSTIPLVRSDGEGIRIQWDVKRSNTPNSGTGKITLTNLAESVQQQVYQAWLSSKLRAGLFIGWASTTQLLIDAIVTKVEPDVPSRDRTDVMTVIHVGEALDKLRDATVSADFANVGLPFLVKQVADELGIGLPPQTVAAITAAALGLPIQNFKSWSLQGNARDNLNTMMATLNLTPGIFNNDLVVFKGGIIPGPVFILGPTSGLIEQVETDDGGRKAKAHGNPQIVPGRGIQFRDEAGKVVGTTLHRVERCHWRGDSDSFSDMDITARKIADELISSVPLVFV